MVARTTLTGSQGELVMEREVIPVNYLSDIDADWRFTDAAGHEHHCEYEAADPYPTLRRVVYETYWCDTCEDEHELERLECRLCGEKVRPGTTGPGTRFIQGVLTCTFNGEPVTEERARELVAGWDRRG
jgi:hypothetical protein